MEKTRKDSKQNKCSGGAPLYYKGFTLIELLAVILILGVIALIAIPIVTNIIRDAKEGALLRSAEGIIKSAENYYQINSLKGNFEPITFNSPEYSGLDFTGKKPESGILTINTNGEVVIALYDSDRCVYKSYTDENPQIIDNITQTDCLELVTEVVEKDYLMAGTSGAETTPFLGGPLNKEQIETLTFVNSKTIPAGVIGSFDVSSTGNGSIMAWYTAGSTNDRYDLYIGSNGGVLANPISTQLFYNLASLKEIDLTRLDTNKVTKMNSMFDGMTSLTSLDLSNFDTSNVTDMNYMFKDMSSITSLNLSNFYTNSVLSMQQMFGGMTNLATLDLSSFDMSAITATSNMFYNTPLLTSVLVKDATHQTKINNLVGRSVANIK